MKNKIVNLRCDCHLENLVFMKFDYDDLDTSYEFSIEDSYIGGNYKGFFGRLKRAWRTFINKPLVYTSIYTEDKEQVKQFLNDCLKAIEEKDQ